MKTRRTLYVIIGSLLLVLNLILDLLDLSEHKQRGTDTAYNVGYILGSHIFAIVGLIFLRLAYKLHKRINAVEDEQLDDINNIGLNN
ncbi:MAG TPA: hypothetical protein VHL77_08510 [Ferruginibacter sp.]|nr:hypothetical protein [Ferruginibacter sp.]